MPARVAGEVYNVDGNRIEITLTQEQPEMMQGEPAYFAFVLQNGSGEDWWVLVGGDNINRLHRPSSFFVRVTGADGKAVAQPDADDSVGGNSMMGPQKIPAHGSYAFRLLVSDWATLTTPGAYSVAVQKKLILGRWKNLDHWQEQRQTIPVRIDASFKAVPLDAVKMGQVIARLGDIMLHGPRVQAQAAATTLAYVDDLRAVPYFVQAARVPDYTLMFMALDALGRYNDEAAFQVLRHGLTTSAADFESEAAKHGLNESSFDNLRYCAACALCKSPYPGAFQYLVSIQKELDEKARNSVAIGLATKMSSEEAIPVLREMMHDPVDWVRLDAEQSLVSRLKRQVDPVASVSGK